MSVLCCAVNMITRMSHSAVVDPHGSFHIINYCNASFESQCFRKENDTPKYGKKVHRAKRSGDCANRRSLRHAGVHWNTPKLASQNKISSETPVR